MTTPIFSSQYTSNNVCKKSRGLFTVGETFFNVTIMGEEGEYEEFEIEASSSREAGHKALCLTSIVDVQYIDVASF